jgi:hypothetical protein
MSRVERANSLKPEIVPCFRQLRSVIQVSKQLAVSQEFVRKTLLEAGIQPPGRSGARKAVYERKHAADRGNGWKRCAKCGALKPLDSFCALKRSPDGLHFRCKVCVNQGHRQRLAGNPEALNKARENCRNWHAQHREISRARAKAHYHNNKDRHRETRWLRKYGITRAQFDAILSAKGGRCAICRREGPTRGDGMWHVDHDHTTGAVRGSILGIVRR